MGAFKVKFENKKVSDIKIAYIGGGSRLGWKPSMLYMTDKRHLEWKLRQIDYVIENEIGRYRKCVNN